MAARGGTRRGLHLTQQRIHLRPIEPTARRGSSRDTPAARSPHRASRTAPSPRRVPPVHRRDPAAAVPDRASRAPRAAHAPAPRRGRTPRSPGPAATVRRRAPAAVRIGRRHVHHGGQQQRLRPHAAIEHLLAQRLMGQPLVRGVLVHQHQRAVAGDRDHVGVEHLRHRRAKRMLRARFGCGQHARRRCGTEAPAAPRPCPAAGRIGTAPGTARANAPDAARAAAPATTYRRRPPARAAGCRSPASAPRRRRGSAARSWRDARSRPGRPAAGRARARRWDGDPPRSRRDRPPAPRPSAPDRRPAGRSP